jgi:cytochrome c oxidase assembly factor CtaG
LIPKNKLNHNSHHKKKIRDYFLIGIFGILIFILVQPAFLEFTESDLAYHMTIEHTLFFVIGVMSVQVAETILKLCNRYKNNHSCLGIVISLWAKLLRKLFTVNKYGYVWIIIAIGLLTFWHLPWIFDYAELNAPVHIAQHISFILVGAMAFLAARSLRESFTLLALFALNGIMGFAGLIFTLLDRPIYLVYSVNSHNNAGTYMLVCCIVLLLLVLPVYLIRRALFHVNIKRRTSLTFDSNFSTAEK